MLNIHTLALGDYQTNCYLVWGDDSESCLVIDPGFTPERVLAQAERLGKRIDAVLLTHGHFDHVGGARYIAAETDCRVYLCPADLAMPAQMTAGPLYYTHTYEEGTVVKEAGVTLRVLHTPGHTPGSVCLEAGNTLFSGDTLFQGSCGRTDLPGGSWTEIRASLKRLAALPGDRLVYPGHGPSTYLEGERRYNPYMG